MKEEMRTEAIEVIVSSVEKFAGKYDLAVMLIPSHLLLAAPSRCSLFLLVSVTCPCPTSRRESLGQRTREREANKRIIIKRGSSAHQRC
jgi:hypothetical protein